MGLSRVRAQARIASIERYIAERASVGVIPFGGEAFRRSLKAGDIVAVECHNGRRYALEVTRITTNYIWANSHTGRDGESGFSISTGLWFGGGHCDYKPHICTATAEEKAGYKSGSPAKPTDKRRSRKA